MNLFYMISIMKDFIVFRKGRYIGLALMLLNTGWLVPFVPYQFFSVFLIKQIDLYRLKYFLNREKRTIKLLGRQGIIFY